MTDIILTRGDQVWLASYRYLPEGAKSEPMGVGQTPTEAVNSLVHNFELYCREEV
jgi:hypothetical protein